MNAIDFQSLRRVERKKCRDRRRNKGSTTSDHHDVESKLQVATSSEPCCQYEINTASLNACSLIPLHIPSLLSLPPTSFLSTFDRNEHLVWEDPSSVFYVPNYLCSTGQKQLVDWLLTCLPDNPIESCSNPQQSNGKWTKLKYAGRRVALFDARIQPFPEPLSTLAQQLSQSILSNVLSLFERTMTSESTTSTDAAGARAIKKNILPQINHILINDYDTPEVGILPHTDGPAYEPCTITLSLASNAILKFTRRPYQHDDETVGESNPASASPQQSPTSLENRCSANTDTALDCQHQLWLEAGSLVVFCGEAYSDWLHSILSISKYCGRARDAAVFCDSNKVSHSSFLNQGQKPSPMDRCHKSLSRRISLTFRIARAI
ncbi:hypothetical protein ACA910_000393 [Epithemia clementina (nom. ined.)]